MPNDRWWLVYFKPLKGVVPTYLAALNCSKPSARAFYSSLSRRAWSWELSHVEIRPLGLSASHLHHNNLLVSPSLTLSHYQNPSITSEILWEQQELTEHNISSLFETNIQHVLLKYFHFFLLWNYKYKTLFIKLLNYNISYYLFAYYILLIMERLGDIAGRGLLRKF